MTRSSNFFPGQGYPNSLIWLHFITTGGLKYVFFFFFSWAGGGGGGYVSEWLHGLYDLMSGRLDVLCKT